MKIEFKRIVRYNLTCKEREVIDEALDILADMRDQFSAFPGQDEQKASEILARAISDIVPVLYEQMVTGVPEE